MSLRARLATVASAASPTALAAALLASALTLLATLACAAAAWGAAAGTISEFSIPTAESGVAGIAPGPDGNVWFTEYEAGPGLRAPGRGRGGVPP